MFFLQQAGLLTLNCSLLIDAMIGHCKIVFVIKWNCFVSFKILIITVGAYLFKFHRLSESDTGTFNC